MRVGGEIDREQIAVTVSPYRLPSWQVATTQTPLASWRIPMRKLSRSEFTGWTDVIAVITLSFLAFTPWRSTDAHELSPVHASKTRGNLRSERSATSMRQTRYLLADSGKYLGNIAVEIGKRYCRAVTLHIPPTEDRPAVLPNNRLGFQQVINLENDNAARLGRGCLLPGAHREPASIGWELGPFVFIPERQWDAE
jgi:hypothetical protein